MAATKEQLLIAIERAEKALGTNLREGAKANLQKQVEQMKKDLAALEVETIKKEEKIEQKEQDVKEDLDAEIAKWEILVKKKPAEKTLIKWEAKLLELKKKKEQMAQEAKEDKAEAKQELKEVKEAVKDIEKAVATGTTTPIKKPEIKEKQRESKSKQRIKSMLTTLQQLVQKNKELKARYDGQKVDLKRDAGRSAKPFGYRFVGKKDYRVPTELQIKKGLKRGTIDYEARPNRSDKYAAGFKGNIREKLADGGETGKMAKGGMIVNTYARMLNELNKEKQFNKKIEKKSQLDKFAKSNDITIDNNNIIYIKGERVGYIDKINQKTGQEKSNWELKTFADGGSVRGGKFNVGDTVMVNDSGYVKYFSEFDLSKPVTIISKNKTKLNRAGKSFTAYSYGIQLADGRKPFNNAPEQLLTAVGNTEEELTGERAGERRAEMGYAKGGKIGHRLNKFYEEAKDSNSVKDLKIVDKDEFNFICKSDNNCKVSIRYDKDSDTIVMIQHRKSGNEDDDISLAQFKKYLSDKMAKGGVAYSSDDAYMIDVFVDNKLVQQKIVFARNQREAEEKAEDLDDDFTKKHGDHTIKVYLAPPKMAKGGKLVGNQSKLDMNKNGKLDKEDFEIIRGEKKMTKGGKLRKNSKHRFCWSKDAVKDKIITKEQLNTTPSEYMRKKYPAYIMEK
jgi:hypothetical protein